VDLLCIDELGYMELDKRGAELLFQVLTEREEKASVPIASNEAFSGWTKTFTAPPSLGRRSPRTTPVASLPGGQAGQQRHHLRDQQHRDPRTHRRHRPH